MRVSDDDQALAKQQHGIKTVPAQGIATLANGTVEGLYCEIYRPRSGGKQEACIGMRRLKPPKPGHEPETRKSGERRNAQIVLSPRRLRNGKLDPFKGIAETAD